MSSNNIRKLDEFITDTKNVKEKENFWCNSKLSDWKIVKLEEVGRIVNGFAFPIKYQGKKDGKYLFIKVSDMNIAGNEKFIFTSENTIDDALAERLRVRIYPPGTIIFPKIGMVIYLKKVRILAKYGTFDNNLMGIIPNKAIIDTEFLYYYLLGKVDFTRLVGRTTAPSIKKSDIEKLKIPLPPIGEQRRIAEVLSTVDEAIRLVDESIARTERLKKGLMQELLTKGIGHKEFKQTEIGKIPKEWRIAKLGDLGDFQYGYTVSASKENTGIKLLRITDIKENGFINWDEVPYCQVREEIFKRYKLNVGDVLFTRIGATTGKTCYIDAPVQSIFGSYLIRFIPKKPGIDMRFLYFYTQSKKYWNQINRLKSGRLKMGLNITQLKSLQIPLPPLHEQEKIVEILWTIDKKLEAERNRKKKLERIKRALMNLLLTGKVRLKVRENVRS